MTRIPATSHRMVAGSSRIPATSHRMVSASSIRAPAHLSERAGRLWSEVVPRRANSPERQALVLVALEALTRADEARELIAREGMVVNGGKMPHAHPALKIERDATGTFTRVWTALGLARNMPILIRPGNA